MGNGMNKVLDGLYIGSLSDAENRKSLTENGITHILSVYNNPRPLFEDKTYLCIDVYDSCSENLLRHFKNAIGFIHGCRVNGGACLVHCLAGVSRSTTMVVAYLMTITDYGFDDCLAAVKVVRSCVCPNYSFQSQLLKYKDGQVSEYRAWLKSSFPPSPFNDKEQVAALLRVHREGPNPDDPESSS